MSEMDRRVIATTVEALRRVNAPRHFQTGERGYQGWFFSALQSALDEMGLLGRARVVEMEYQKSRLIHGTGQRPDIVVHVPRSRAYMSARRGNLVVYELKKRATKGPASGDLLKLRGFVDQLDYRLGIFVNVDAEDPGLHRSGLVRDSRIHAFSVRRGPRGVVIRHEWNAGPSHEARGEIIVPGGESTVWGSFESLIPRRSRPTFAKVQAGQGNLADRGDRDDPSGV
jgi:hypothetical protein